MPNVQPNLKPTPQADSAALPLHPHESDTISRLVSWVAGVALILFAVNVVGMVLGILTHTLDQFPLVLLVTGVNCVLAGGLHLICRIILQRIKQTSHLLNTYRQQQRAIIDAIPDTIMVVNDKGILLDHQSQQLQQFGVNLSPWIGTSLEEVIPEMIKPTVLGAFQQAITTRALQMIEFEVKSILDSDETYVYELRIIPYETDRLLAILQDITTKRQAREQSVALELERERVRLVTSFIRNMSHEFRSPLAVIGSSAEMLVRTHEVDARIRRVERIHEQIGIITELLDALVLMTRLESGLPLHKNPVNLVEVVDMLVIKSNVQWQTTSQPFIEGALPPEPANYPVLIDRLLIDTALTNIMHHISRASETAAPIRVSLSITDDSAIIAISTQRLEAPDKDILRYLFERLYRSDEPSQTNGTSLGLAVARKIIELHGGTISIVPVEENHSTLSIRLPRQP